MKTFLTIGQYVLKIIIALMVPFILIIAGVRLLMTPLYPQIEYHMPYFPADSFGFSLSDRLHWSAYAIDYLVNDAGINYLGDLKFSDGSPLFNERELSHMQDVKNLVQTCLKIWLVCIVLLILLAIWAWRGGWLNTLFRSAISTGGWITVGLIFAMLLGVLLNFDVLFTDFHHLFFTGDSWLFYTSDTLIRLFPMTFWRDAFILVGSLNLLAGLALGWFLSKKPTRSLA